MRIGRLKLVQKKLSEDFTQSELVCQECSDRINIKDFIDEYCIEEWDKLAKEDLIQWLEDEDLRCDCLQGDRNFREWLAYIYELEATEKVGEAGTDG